jgi:hypothetical protein
MNPSLLLIPDRYKAEKLYSQIPDSGAGDLDFTRVGDTATRVNSAGLIEPVLADIPRIDYTGGGCGKLLLEPQRTNVCLYSEDFSNAAWSKDALGTGTTPIITPNYTISPDGTQNADRLQFSAVGKVLTSDYSLSGQFPINLSASGTMTFYMKSLTSSSQNVLAYWGGGQGGVFVATPEWQRFTLSNLTAGIANPAFGTRGGTGFTAGGDEVLDISVWGVQVEVGSYASSYIPTLDATVTRGADVCSKTGISSLIGVNGGSIFVELDANGLDLTAANYVFDLSDGTNFDQNRIAMYWTSPNDLSVFYGYGGTFNSQTYTFNFLTTKKVAVRWTSTQIQVVVNGVAQTAVTYGNSSPTKLNLASRFNNVEPLFSNIKVCALYNNTLSTAELQTLTTL